MRSTHRSGFGTALLAVIFLLVVAPFLGAASGCAWNPFRSQAREAQQANEAEILAAEEAKAKAEQDRQKLAAAVDQFVAGAVKIDDLAGVLGADAVAALKADADAKLAQMRAGLGQWDALIQQNADALAALYTKRTALAQEVEREDDRVDARWGTIESLAGGLALATGGGGGLTAALFGLVGSVRKRIAKARAEGEVNGRRLGAGIVMDTIEAGKSASPALREAFDKLTSEQKQGMHIIAAQLPEFWDLFRDPTPTAKK